MGYSTGGLGVEDAHQPLSSEMKTMNQKPMNHPREKPSTPQSGERGQRLNAERFLNYGN